MASIFENSRWILCVYLLSLVAWKNQQWMYEEQFDVLNAVIASALHYSSKSGCVLVGVEMTRQKRIEQTRISRLVALTCISSR